MMAMKLSEESLKEQNKNMIEKDISQSEPLSLEPQVQIKEENDFSDETFNVVKIKKEVEEFEVKQEVFECEDIKVEQNESTDDADTEYDDLEEDNCPNPDVVKKINAETRKVVQKRWSSLISKTTVKTSNIEPPDALKCHKCRIHFQSKADLIDHEENHIHKFFHCSQCDMVFDREFSLKVHQSFHGAPRLHKCNICEKTFTRKSTLKDHALSHTGEKPYQCDVCKKFYRSKVSLISHLRYHSQNKKYECPVCKKLFFQPSGLSEHLTMHRNDKEFKCHICGKYLAYTSTLKRHVKSHSEPQTFPCDECDKYFKQYSSLKVHKTIKHLGLKPFKCEDCDKTFTTSWSLKNHMNTHRVLQVPSSIEIVTRKKIS